MKPSAILSLLIIALGVQVVLWGFDEAAVDAIAVGIIASILGIVRLWPESLTSAFGIRQRRRITFLAPRPKGARLAHS